MEDKKTPKHYIWSIAIILCIIPIMLWFFTKRPYIHHVGINSTSHAIANFCGLIGITLLSYSVILSTLFKGFENFGYLYRPHHLIGKIAAIFIISHPLLTSIRFFHTSFTSGLYLIFGDFDIELVFGKLALIGTIVLMLYALYIKTESKLWKFIHRWFFLIFLLAVLHVTFMPNDLNKNISLKIYIFSLMYSTIGFIVYKNFIRSLTKKSN